MPSKINNLLNPIKKSINILKIDINNLTELIKNLEINYNSLKSRVTNIKQTADKALTANKSYGLIDLIANKTPTFSGWTVEPTDSNNITDNNISTFCTTGNKVAPGGYQEAFFEWDLGSFYNVLLTGAGSMAATAGTPYIWIYFYNGTNWYNPLRVSLGSSFRHFSTVGGKCSKVRIGISSSVAATLTPNIREFNVWKLQ